MGLVPSIAATGMVVSLAKGTLTTRGRDGRHVREGKYIVKVSRRGDTKYVGPFKTKAQADAYARKARVRFRMYKVTVIT